MLESSLTSFLGQGAGQGHAATSQKHVTLWLWEGVWLERQAWHGASDLVG